MCMCKTALKEILGFVWAQKTKHHCTERQYCFCVWLVSSPTISVPSFISAVTWGKSAWLRVLSQLEVCLCECEFVAVSMCERLRTSARGVCPSVCVTPWGVRECRGDRETMAMGDSSRGRGVSMQAGGRISHHITGSLFAAAPTSQQLDAGGGQAGSGKLLPLSLSVHHLPFSLGRHKTFSSVFWHPSFALLPSPLFPPPFLLKPLLWFSHPPLPPTPSAPWFSPVWDFYLCLAALLIAWPSSHFPSVISFLVHREPRGPFGCEFCWVCSGSID